MARLKRGASGGRHVRWAGEIVAAVRAHIEINGQLTEERKAKLSAELDRVSPVFVLLSASVRDYRAYLDGAHVDIRAKQRVANYICDEAQRVADGGTRPYRAEIDRAAPGGMGRLFSNLPLSRVLSAGHERTVRRALDAAAFLRTLPPSPDLTRAATKCSGGACGPAGAGCDDAFLAVPAARRLPRTVTAPVPIDLRRRAKRASSAGAVLRLAPVSTLHEPTIALSGLRPTHLEVDLAQLAANYRAIERFAGGAKVMPILKANAYGHGLVEVARMLEEIGAPAAGVAYLEEGLRLRESGVRMPVLVLGGIVGEQIPLFIENELTLTASSVDKLRAIEACAASMKRTASVHLKIDTGMERIGVHWYSAEPLLEASLACEHVRTEGVFTHFANADDADLLHARLQLERFLEVMRFYERRSLPVPLRHAANSGAILQLPESHLDLVRPGILFYGAVPSPHVSERAGVRGAMRWVTRVVYFKVVKPGNPVSYGSTWTPESMTRLITVPVGYGDGYPRALSGQAEVLVGGERRAVVGRICMDQVMVSIGSDGTAYNGDEVVLLGVQGEERITVEELAQRAGTIPHEILAGINTRVPRVYLAR